MNLENKKKKELIEIILRKDAVEEKLRQDIKEKDEFLNQNVEEYSKLNDEYRELNALCYHQEHYIAKLKMRNWLWFTTTIISILAALLAVVL